MNASTAQRYLKGFSIVSLIFGILGLVFGILMLLGSGMALGNVEGLSEAGLTSDEVAQFSGAFIVAGLTTIFSGITNIVDWAFLKKVAKDARKYKGALVVTVVSLILNAISLISSISSGENIASSVVAVALNAFILYLISVVKKSVTE